MRIALAQFDARLGDVDGIFDLLCTQAELARDRNVDLLCVPAPLFSGASPLTVVDSPAFEHDALVCLGRLARSLADSDMAVLVPLAVSLQGSPFLEVFLLKDGRVSPLRLTYLHRVEGTSMNPFAPPIFDIKGTRVAVVLDLDRDLDAVPVGCDLALFFQADGFDSSDGASWGIGGLADSSLPQLVRARGVWFAEMAPIGGYDDVTFIGGSFVLDDGARVVASAPCFEEMLLVCDVMHGEDAPSAAPLASFPALGREELIWGALKLSLRDALHAQGRSRVAVCLAGDLASSLLAVLAVDSLGTRSVLGVLVEREDWADPRDAAEEMRRVSLVRGFARRLGIRVIERSVSDGTDAVDSDSPVVSTASLRGAVTGLCFVETARELGAVPLAAITKTDAALASGLGPLGVAGDLAPFGDVFLTDLEFLARQRNRESAVIPQDWIGLTAVSSSMSASIARALAALGVSGERDLRARQLLEMLGAAEVDDALKASIERGLTFDDIALSKRRPEALALLLLLVRCGEGARRRLPMAPIVSARSFSERPWPVQLGWSDTGAGGQKMSRADDLAREEAAQHDREDGDHEKRVRREFFEMLGSMLGISPDEISTRRRGEGASGRMDSDEGDEGRDDGEGPGSVEGTPFFSKN